MARQFCTDNDGTLAVNGGRALQVGFTSGLAVFGGKKGAATVTDASAGKGASK